MLLCAARAAAAHKVAHCTDQEQAAHCELGLCTVDLWWCPCTLLATLLPVGTSVPGRPAIAWFGLPVIPGVCACRCGRDRTRAVVV